VTLPDGSLNRINTAHFYAEAASPGIGPEAAVKTVSSNFGLTLHRYLRIDFEGFVTIIDSVGGITVNVESPKVDHFNRTRPPAAHRCKCQCGSRSTRHYWKCSGSSETFI
jgi:anionic cell wall polymer biosynthesis LytR-Cps2A-Psr (LCP) family protein